MNKSFLTFLTILLTFSFNINSQDSIVTDERVSEITERLQNYSNDELLERREFIINQLEEEDEDGSASQTASRSELLFELSILEQLLVLAGLIILDNVTED